MSVRFVFLSALLLMLAACSRNPFEVTISRCLAVAVVGDLGTLTRFDEPGRSTEDVKFTASISDVQSSCSEDADVRSEVSFYVGARSGPALKGKSITIPYFVAVLKDNSQIVSKRIFSVTLEFDENGIARSRQVIGQTIPTIDQARRYNYELLLGFQLNAQDAVFNMER
jgi:hypothetical protein